jgi:hypothetical protein
MAAGSGSIIEAVDYNTIRNKVIAIMGSGSGQSGYGQTLLSSAVATGNTVTKVQWDALRWDIVNARVHQDGETPTVIQATVGQPIRYGAGHPNNQYDLQADTVVSNKWLIGTGQFVVDSGTSAIRSTSWLTNVSAICTITFGTADQARWFFNSGGKIRITSSRSGGTASPQNNSWTNLLDSAGITELSGNSAGLDFYELTTGDQVLRSVPGSGAYAGNLYTISARCNVANNVGGTANIVYLTVTFSDSYIYTGSGGTTFPDLVDGTLSITVDELRASGNLLPNGTGPFVITSPSYSITSITGS